MAHQLINSYSYFVRPQTSEIRLYKDDEVVGYLYFHHDTDAIRQATDKEGVIHIHYPLSQFAAILDLLRHEPGVYIMYVESERHAEPVAYLGTGRAIVGRAT